MRSVGIVLASKHFWRLYSKQYGKFDLCVFIIQFWFSDSLIRAMQSIVSHNDMGGYVRVFQ